jgi:hypothetical protein
MPNPGHPDQEDPLAADDVPEAATGDQQQRERQRVGGAEPLHVRGRAAQRRVDRRRRHLHDRGVEQVHRLRHQQRDQHQPAPSICHVRQVAVGSESLPVSG